MSISKENLVIISSLGALVLVVLLLIMPAFDSVNINRQIISERQSALEQAKLFNEKISELNNQYKSEELENLLSVLPKQEELSDLLIQLERLATDNGLIMESVDFSKIEQSSQVQEPQSTDQSGEGVATENGQEVQVQPYKILLVSLKLNGAYDAFKNYLQAVEKNKRIMDVTSLSLNTSSGIAQNFFFSVNLQVYYQ
jgi:Tfp pilus assembly protein PilO